MRHGRNVAAVVFLALAWCLLLAIAGVMESTNGRELGELTIRVWFYHFTFLAFIGFVECWRMIWAMGRRVVAT